MAALRYPILSRLVRVATLMATFSAAPTVWAQDCPVQLERDSQGALSRIRFEGVFAVDYRVPTPGSGLYGVYNWSATFDSDVHLNKIDVRRAWFEAADVIEGNGKPVFWDVPDILHRILLKPDAERPTMLQYQSVYRALGVLPTIVIDLNCRVVTADNQAFF